MRIARLALLALLFALALPATALADLNVDFQAISPGDLITDQYAGQGVSFGDGTDFGLGLTPCGAPRGTDQGISGRGALISCHAGEFQGPSVGAAFEFDSERKHVSLRLLGRHGPLPVTVSIHRIGGGTLESRQINLPDGVPVTVDFQRAVAEIVDVRITGGDVNASYLADVVLDDVFAASEASPPPQKFSIALQQPAATVTEGNKISVPVSIRRFNGSTGPVQLSRGGLPSGIASATFSTNPVNGRDPTQLIITATKPFTGDRQITVSAAPAPGAPATVGTAEGGAVVQSIHVQPILSFDGRAGAVTPFVAGCTAGGNETVRVRDGYAGDVVVRSEMLSGPGGGPQQSTFHTTGAFMNDFSFPVVYTGPAPGVMRLTLTPTNGTPVTFDIPYTSASSIDSATPTAVQTPRALKPGTTVTLHAAAFCNSPAARVRFGNENADAPISSVSPDGSTITAEVPRLATSGPVQFLASPTATPIDGPALTVDSYRNTVGFSFHNYKPHLTVDQMSTAFGKGTTHLTANVCGVFSLGLVNCRVITPIPDPWAMVVLGIANLTMGGGDGGACFGFSRTSQQVRLGQRPLTGLGGTAATPNAFALSGPAGPNGTVNEAINANQMLQLSNEYLSFYLANAAVKSFTRTASSLRADLTALLRQNDHPLLSLRDGGSVTDLHVVVAYDIENDPDDPASYYIDVYDSNDPFAVKGYKEGDKTAVDGEDDNATLHQTRALSSRIHVRSDGFWSLPSSNLSASNLGNIVMGSSSNPTKATLVGTGKLKDTITLLFGSAAGALLRTADPNGPAPAAPPAKTAQISSGGKTLLAPDGDVNRDPATALNGTPWVPATGGDGATEGFLLGEGPKADYTVDLKGDRGGSQTRTMIGDGVIAQLTSQTRAGVTDQATLSPSDGGIGFSPGGGSVPIALDTMARLDDGSTRSIEMTATSGAGGHDAIAFDAARKGVRITHGGRPTTVTLTLSSSSGDGLPQAARVKVKVGKGTTTVAPASWSKLAGGRLRVSGKGTLALRRVSKRGTVVRSLSVAKKLATARVKVPATVADGATTVTFVLTRGRKVVARKSVQVNGTGARTATWRLPAGARRHDRLTALATTVVADRTIIGTAVSKKAVRLR